MLYFSGAPIVFDETDLFLLIRKNASNEVRIGVLQRAHEFRQLLFVQLTDSSEHALFDVRLETRCGIVGIGSR